MGAMTDFRMAIRKGRGLRVGQASALLAMVVLFLPFSAAAAAAATPEVPAATASQQAELIANPSIVYVGVTWKGFVYVPKTVDGVTFTTQWWGPYTARTACSGYIADSTGFVVTAGHCVDNQSMIYGGKAALIDAFMVDLKAVAGTTLTQREYTAVRQAVESVGRVEATTSGSPPQRTVTVYPTGMTSVTGLVADTMEYKALDAGDVALLKVNARTALPMLVAAPTQPASGTPIVAGGYPGSVTQIVDAGQAPSFKDGQTSSVQTVNGVPFTEVSAAITNGMSGGPAVDVQGRVVGTVSWSPSTEGQAFHFITATATLRAMLARNGVSTQLTSADTAYRSGIAAFYSRHYHDAVADFDKVLAVTPGHAQALDLRRQAIDNYPNEAKTASSSNVLLFAGIGAAVVVVAGLTAFLLLRRRRHGGSAPAVAGPQPTAGLPTPGTFEQAVPTSAPEVRTPEIVPASPVEPVADAAPPAVAPPPPEPAPPAPATSAPLGGFCPNCGAPHAEGAHFCELCGAHFAEPATAGPGRNGPNGSAPTGRSPGL